MLDTKQLLDLANFREGVREYGRARDSFFIHRFFVDEAPRNLALKSAALSAPRAADRRVKKKNRVNFRRSGES